MKRGFGSTCPECSGSGFIQTGKDCACEGDCFCLWGHQCASCEGRGVVDEPPVQQPGSEPW